MSRLEQELADMRRRNQLRLMIGRMKDSEARAELQRQLDVAEQVDREPKKSWATPPLTDRITKKAEYHPGVHDALCLACGSGMFTDPHSGDLFCPNRSIYDHSEAQMRRVALELDRMGHCNPNPPSGAVQEAVRRTRLPGV